MEGRIKVVDPDLIILYLDATCKQGQNRNSNEHKRAVRRIKLLYDFAYTVQIFISNLKSEFRSGKIITGLDTSGLKVPV